MKESSTKLFVIALIGTICFCLFIFIKQLIKEYKSRNSILNGYFVSADMFLKKWNERYKNETWNKSGCYVILIYSHAIKEFHKEKYEAIYIGQSLHLANRVKQHLQGNGNKNVYHDYQNGKQIYIHLERCMPSYMNRMEKDLIRSFKATRSYNIQKGGGWHSEVWEIEVGKETIEHPAVYEKKWVVDKPAWDEKVSIGFKCECGKWK